MGLDYIRAHAGAPWVKRWKDGLNRLKEPSLFDIEMFEARRTVTVELLPGLSLKTGDTLVVESRPTGLIVGNGLRRIGRVSNPTADLMKVLAKCSGYAEATIERMGLFGDTAEVSLR